jgi:hypothetical protein
MSTVPSAPVDEVLSCWINQMRRGQFAADWATNDALRQAGNGRTAGAPRDQQQIWDGTPIDGRRVLVRCYHGLGDTIQFIRYARLLRERAREGLVWAQPRLIPVLATVHGIDHLIPLHDGAVEADYDVDVEIMERAVPVSHGGPNHPSADSVHRGRSRAASDNRARVGLVWTAGEWAPHRSIPFRLLAPLVRAPVGWYVLQGGHALAERPDDFGIPAGTADIVEAACVMRSLDLVITIDSMPAHLAGAVGAPEWTLLAADADWRWMTARSDSPWYPTMRLFKQPRPGEWEPVIAEVAAELKRTLDARSTAASQTPGGQRPRHERPITVL